MLARLTPAAAERLCVLRLQDMELQYRREKEEADLLLEQHRLVGAAGQVTWGQVTAG